MSEGTEDRGESEREINPFGWGPRPTGVSEDSLARLMSSKETDRGSAPRGSSAPSTDRREFGPTGPEFVESESESESESELAVEEQLWANVHPDQAPIAGSSADAATETTSVTAPPRDPAAPRPVAGADSRKLQGLRLLLLANLVMIAVMLALPHPLETRPEYQSSDPAEDVAPAAPPGSAIADPVPAPPSPSGTSPGTTSLVLPVQPPQLGLPQDARYEQALLHARAGRFDEASRSLEAFLGAHPDLNPALQRLVHAHLAYYLQKAGRVSEAIVHENEMRSLAGRASLPEELLESARAAERSGDGTAMRRAYAQFLLQRDQLSPSMRALIQEAYLEFGDAYRLEADAGEERSR